MKSFKEYLNEEYTPDLNLQLSNFIATTFAFSTQSHVYHLLTKSYAEHIAIGDFYAAIKGLNDGIAESVIAIGGIIAPTINPQIMYSYSKEVLVQQLNEYRSMVNSLLMGTNEAALASINDMLINVQSNIDGLVYKLGLK